jgi:hypothetical protein
MEPGEGGREFRGLFRVETTAASQEQGVSFDQNLQSFPDITTVVPAREGDRQQTEFGPERRFLNPRLRNCHAVRQLTSAAA